MTKDLEMALKSEKAPIFIWGAGEVGILTKKALDKAGIVCKGYVVDASDNSGGVLSVCLKSSC